jgi:hypothetical protein
MKIVAVLIAAVVASSIAIRAEEPVVGVVEEKQCDRDSIGPIVRVMFAKGADGWRTLDTNASWSGLDLGKRTWTIAFDGRERGQVQTPELKGQPTADRRDRFLKVAAGDSVPRIANTAKRFAGWCDSPKRRPLVLVSGGGRAADPESWKPYAVAPGYRDSIFPAFAKMYAGLDEKAVTCATKSSRISWKHRSSSSTQPANASLEPTIALSDCGGASLASTLYESLAAKLGRQVAKSSTSHARSRGAIGASPLDSLSERP